MEVSIKAYLDKRAKKKLKPLYLQANYNSTRKKVSTGIKCLPSDIRNNNLRMDHPQKRNLDNQIKELHKLVSGKEIEIRTSKLSLPDMIRSFISEVNHLKSETIRGYNNLLDNITHYEKEYNIKYSIMDVSGNSFMYFKGFFDYLHNKGLLNSSMVIMFAKIDKILDWYQLDFSTNQKKIFAGVLRNSGTEKILISTDQADSIYSYSGTKKENEARDMFIFCYDTGIRGSELKGLSAEVTERYDLGNSGIKYFTTEALIKKNGRSRFNTIYLTERAMEIYNRREKNLNLMWATQANKLLKIICRNIGGDFLKVITQIKYSAAKELKTNHLFCDLISLHTARHSRINNLKNIGISDQDISVIVNHTSPNTTRKHYIQNDVLQSIDKIRIASR